MNGKFTHYLITRYNVRLDHWEKDARGQPTLQDHWMSHRFQLFSSYCLPSVVAQSEKNFIWLIYLESSTSPIHLEQITNLVRPFPFIQLQLVSGYFDCMNNIDHHLTLATTEYVITSRMDNDDAIGLDYIRTVQLHFAPRDRTLINLLHGYGYNPIQQIATRLHHITHNSFGSFVEKKRVEGGHISVRGFPHGNPPAGTEQIEVHSTYGWLRIFHDRNLLSKPFGYPVFHNYFLSNYGIERKFLQLSLTSTIGYSMKWFWGGLGRRINKVTQVKGQNK